MKYTIRNGLPLPFLSGSFYLFDKFLFREGEYETSFIVLIPRFCFCSVTAKDSMKFNPTPQMAAYLPFA